MPRLSRWFIRASLIHLTAGFTLGGLLLIQKVTTVHPLLWRLMPAHGELLLIGWILQLTMGVAYWILPRFSRPPVRGNAVAAYSAFFLLNAGVVLSALGPALARWAVLGLAGRGGTALAALAFAFNAWPRVKATERTPRDSSLP